MFPKKMGPVYSSCLAQRALAFRMSSAIGASNDPYAGSEADDNQIETHELVPVADEYVEPIPNDTALDGLFKPFEDLRSFRTVCEQAQMPTDRWKPNSMRSVSCEHCPYDPEAELVIVDSKLAQGMDFTLLKGCATTQSLGTCHCI